MNTLHFKEISKDFHNSLVMTLIYEGRADAIKLYRDHNKCGLKVAQTAIDRIAREIQPGSA